MKKSLYLILILILPNSGLIAQTKTLNTDLLGGCFSGPNNVIFAVDSFVYMDDGGYFEVGKVTDSGDITIVGRMRIFRSLKSIFVSGSYAYLVDGSKIMSVVDISNPSSPSVVESYSVGHFNQDIYITDTLAYIADGDGLSIVNISNPTSPSTIGGINTIFSGGVYVVDMLAYVGGAGGLYIIDVSDPTSPKQIGFSDGGAMSEDDDVCVSGNFAYVVNYCCFLRIVDVSDPTSPVERSSVWLDPVSPHKLYVKDTLVYVANGKGGIVISNVSNPDAPTRIAKHIRGEPLDIWIKDTLAYIASDYGGFRIINISNPETLSEVNYDPGGYALDLYISGNYAYIADDDGLNIIDVSNPSSPFRTGYCELGNYARGVFVLDTFAYVSDYYGGLRIIDVSNPSSPTEEGFYDTGGYALSVFVLDTLAYVADGGDGLRIINISNPACPSEIGYYNTGGYASDVFVLDTFAYVADRDGGLRIIDVSNPSSPTEEGFYDTGDNASGVFAVDTLVYVADNWDGLYIIKTYIDTIPPLIDSTTIWQDTTYKGPFPVQTKVIDTISGIDSVILYYHRSEDTGWYTKRMESIGGDWYEDTIPQVSFYNSIVDYYIEAYDRASNIKDDPDSGYYSFVANLSGVKERRIIPERTELYQNIPNPFTSSTAIKYAVSAVSGKRKEVSIKIYDLTGRPVRILVNEEQSAGYYSIKWNGRNDNGKKVSAGIYFCSLDVNNEYFIKKIILLR